MCDTHLGYILEPVDDKVSAAGSATRLLRMPHGPASALRPASCLRALPACALFFSAVRMQPNQSLRLSPLALPQCVCDSAKGWLTVRLGPDAGKCACTAEGFTFNATFGRCFQDPPPCAPGKPCPCGTADRVLMDGACVCDYARGWRRSPGNNGNCVCSNGFDRDGDECRLRPAWACTRDKGLHCAEDADGNPCSAADPSRCAACA